MKKILMLSALSLVTGCAYLHDRGRDACDMVTLALEAPAANASVQVAEAVLGIGLAGGKGVGLRSGALGVYEYTEVNALFCSKKLLVPSPNDMDRDKGYETHHAFLPGLKKKDAFQVGVQEGKWFNAWQIEATVGLGVAARAGVNFAEILDFILGWTTLDICDDDIFMEERGTSDNKTME